MVLASPTFTSAPSIETERLLLRRHHASDFDVSAAVWADPSVTRYISGRPFTGEEVWTRLLRYAGHWSLLGFGYWVICEKGTNRFVGEVGFADYRRQLTPPLEGAAEAGWMIAPADAGKGLATEALSAALAWGKAHLGSRRIVCLINPENAPSIRVAEKVGFRPRVHTSYHNEPIILFDF